MFWAAINGQIEAMAWLKDRGADVNAKGDDGQTLMSVARDEKTKEWLRANGVRANGAQE